MKTTLLASVCALMVLSGCTDPSGQSSVLNTGTMLGALGGGGVGALLGGKQSLVATLIGAGLGGIMGTIIQNLSQKQQADRRAALLQVTAKPVGGTTAWASPHSSSNRAVTKAHYVNKGVAKNAKGEICHKVQETIELPDGKTGTSEELVCPS